MKSGALQALSLRCRWNKLEANVTSEEYATCEEGNRLLCFVRNKFKKWSGEAPETADGMRTLKAFDLHSDKTQKQR